RRRRHRRPRGRAPRRRPGPLRRRHRARRRRRPRDHRPDRKQPLRPLRGLGQPVRIAVIYLVEAGLAAARRAAPLYFGVLIVAAILFGGKNAMRAADAVASLGRSMPLRLGFWTAWTIATLPAAHVLFATPTTFYLRSLPSTRLPTIAAIVLGLVAVE